MSCRRPPVAAAESEYTSGELDSFKKSGRKFDPVKGCFLPFPGISVVCDVPGSGEPPLSQIPELLLSLPTLSKVFLPLPPESYHVTTLDIACKYSPLHEDAAWESLLREPRWAVAAGALAEAKVTPRLRLKRLYASQRTALIAELEAADAGTAEHPSGLPVNARLVESLGLESNQKHPWHMTIAYCHKSEELDETSEEYEAERAAVEAALGSALPEEVPLDVAKLCRFPDMGAFIPWDGCTL